MELLIEKYLKLRQNGNCDYFKIILDWNMIGVEWGETQCVLEESLTWYIPLYSDSNKQEKPTQFIYIKCLETPRYGTILSKAIPMFIL